MSKKPYRPVPIQRVDASQLSDAVGVDRAIVSVDLAKEKMVASFADTSGQVGRLVRFDHPRQTMSFVELVRGLAAERPIEVVMESTGTYGDPLRYQLRRIGVPVFEIGTKRVHDAAEVFDGVPSLHDAKACVVMTQLHVQGATRLVAEERATLRELAAEALRLRAEVARIDAEIEAAADRMESTKPIAPVMGRLTAAVLVAHLGPLGQYDSAAALEKAAGLNLKIRSSGTSKKGKLAITKRGPSIVRRYLYLATLRFIKDDPLLRAWYQARAGYRAHHKLVAIVALMRKLLRALWHVARGAPFDSRKLVDARRLERSL